MISFYYLLYIFFFVKKCHHVCSEVNIDYIENKWNKIYFKKCSTVKMYTFCIYSNALYRSSVILIRSSLISPHIIIACNIKATKVHNRKREIKQTIIVVNAWKTSLDLREISLIFQQNFSRNSSEVPVNFHWNPSGITLEFQWNTSEILDGISVKFH